MSRFGESGYRGWDKDEALEWDRRFRNKNRSEWAYKFYGMTQMRSLSYYMIHIAYGSLHN